MPQREEVVLTVGREHLTFSPFRQCNHLDFSFPLRKNKYISKKQPKMPMLPTPVYLDELLDFSPNHVDKFAHSACQNMGLL